MAESPTDTGPSFWKSLGLIASTLTGELGGAIAVIGGLTVGFTALGRATVAGTNEWILLTIAGATFSALVWLCRR